MRFLSAYGMAYFHWTWFLVLLLGTFGGYWAGRTANTRLGVFWIFLPLLLGGIALNGKYGVHEGGKLRLGQLLSGRTLPAK